MTTKFTFAVLVTLAAVGCGDAQSTPSASNDASPPPALHAGGAAAVAPSASAGAAVRPMTPRKADHEYRVIEASWPTLTPEQAAARAHDAAEILLGRSLPSNAFSSAAQRALRDSDVWEGFPLGDDTLYVKYFAKTNDLRLTNVALTAESEEDLSRAQSMDESRARVLAQRAQEQLLSAGLVAKGRCSHAEFKVSRTRFGIGLRDGSEPREVTTQYGFLANERIDGVPFMNAGFQVTVHYSGVLSALRLGGAVVTEKSKVQQGDFDATAVQARFQKEFPNARSDWRGLRYFLPTDASGVTSLAPVYVFSFSNVEGGLVSRRHYVGYPVLDSRSPAIEISEKPNEVESGDRRTAPDETVVR